MDVTLPSIIGPSIVAAITAAGTWLATRKPKSDHQDALIDQIQEERQEARAEFQERIAALETKVAQSQEHLALATQESRRATERSYEIQDQARLEISMIKSYVFDLMGHIAAGKPPPPPPVPEMLKRYFYPDQN